MKDIVSKVMSAIIMLCLASIAVIAVIGFAATCSPPAQSEPLPSSEIAVIPTETGTLYLSAGGQAMIATGELAQAQTRGTLSYYAPSPSVSRRLNELRELNRRLTPAPPPVPDTVIIVNQQQTQTMNVDRRRHPRRLRQPRHYRPAELP